MTSSSSAASTKLFYSYCHKDADYRESMEKSLALLRRDGLLQQWSDLKILPGQSISEEIKGQMDQANILVFLLSNDFISSDECVKEWNYAKEMSDNGKTVFRIPIIIRKCPWLDFLKSDDVKALPDDGNPVSQYQDPDLAWTQVYHGIKTVVNRVRATVLPREEYLGNVDRTEFLSQEHLKLQDLFEFPRMICEDPEANEQQLRDITVDNRNELLENNFGLIHGQEKSGKTALARYTYLTLIGEAQPVLFLDAKRIQGRITDTVLRNAYRDQFTGDYDIWRQQENKTLIMDDLNRDSRLPESLDLIKETFDRILITLPSDVFHAFFRDDVRLAEFRQLRILPLTLVQQEKLIRRRLNLSERSTPITDGFVDQVENRVNSVIVSDKLLPRFPFYVLSILQTYEEYMPTNLSVTSYGHCYQALIFANLVLSGISKTDDDVNACFNFSEHLAFATYRHRKEQPNEDFDFEEFVTGYRKQFFIRNAIINRLKSRPYGLIDESGKFRTEFMFYYFLGKCLARNRRLGGPTIEEMCINSHREENYLTLLFAIHHTTDNSIIDDLLLRTMDTLNLVSPATLKPDETKRFRDVIAAIPDDVWTSDSVQEARSKERERREVLEEQRSRFQSDRGEESEENGEGPMIAQSVNGIYKILKNNKILGQVLRNRHGNLDKQTIEVIIQTIADSGLRLVNLVLADEDEIARLASYISQKHTDWDTEKLKEVLRFLSFAWTMINIEQVVEAFNIPEIREAIESVVEDNSTPAYDLIGYFSQLDTASQLTMAERDSLAELFDDHDDEFVQRVLSIRTQRYMNTHRSRAPIEQAICSLLKIRYRPRLLPSS